MNPRIVEIIKMNINNIRGIWRLKQIQKYFFNKSLLFPKLRTCNICNWSGRRFLDDNWLKKIRCPKCKLSERHRLLLFSLQNFSFIDKKILHFGPEHFLISHFNYNQTNYFTADLKRDDVDLNLDISNMNSIQNEEYDLIIASDILEHVLDDQKAIKEMYRILKVGGRAIVTVPQKDDLDTTIEDLTNLSVKEREKKFGVSDHYRIYGLDIKDKFKKAKFHVEIFDSNCVSYKIRKKFVLSPPILGKHPMVTNYRKIYHAIK